jgi:hypothetical protein
MVRPLVTAADAPLSQTAHSLKSYFTARLATMQDLMAVQSSADRLSNILRKVSGQFFRCVLVERLDHVLDPPGPSSAGRYHRLTNTTTTVRATGSAPLTPICRQRTSVGL